jgi:hypothetical protein
MPLAFEAVDHLVEDRSELTDFGGPGHIEPLTGPEQVDVAHQRG